MTTVNYRNYVICKAAKGWHFDGLYRDYGFFETLNEAQNAADDDSCHPNWPLLKNRPERYQEESGSTYYLHLIFGWTFFIIFPIKSLIPFLMYCHFLMVRTINSLFRSDSKTSLVLWAGFMGLHITLIAGIVATTYFATRLPVGILATYEIRTLTQY